MNVKWLVTILCLINYSYYAQINELNHFDCNYSKEIIIPFDYQESQTRVSPPLSQVVFYSYRDQFTYWYKIIAKQNDTLRFKISTLNDSDAFSVFIYQYNNADFCNKLYQQKIKALNNSFDIGQETKDLNFKSIIVKKDHIYYISVLNTSINNCGHQFKLFHQVNDTLVVKAIHLPCKKDLTTIDVNKKLTSLITANDKSNSYDTVIDKKPIKILDTLPFTSKPKIQPTKEINLLSPKKFECVIKNIKNSNILNASISILDVESKDYIFLKNDSNGSWTGNYEEGKLYKIKINAFGYKDLEIERQFSENNNCELYLNPLKVGDNFVMKSIYFHPNTYALKKTSYNDLQKLLDYLLNNPSVIIEIQGHTNGDNKIRKNKAYESLSEEWNFQGSSKKLSLKRAEAIKSFLATNGISEDRLNYQGFGGEKPIIKNPETMEDGQKNIRVEIKILQN